MRSLPQTSSSTSISRLSLYAGLSTASRCADRIFLEWPRSESLTLPTAPELHVVGLDVMTGNYLDDATHRHEPPSARAVHCELTAAGLRIESAGITRVPFLEDHLLAIGRSTDDKVSRTLAYWSFTSWCQYTLAQRVGTPFGQRP